MQGNEGKSEWERWMWVGGWEFKGDGTVAIALDRKDQTDR
jgi:hypothetical protein